MLQYFETEGVVTKGMLALYLRIILKKNKNQTIQMKVNKDE